MTTKMDNTTTVYEFVLIIGAVEVSIDLADRLFEVGCDDGTLGARSGVAYVDFAREAETFREAVLSAIDQTESVGVRVLRVEPDELVTAAAIAKRVGRTRESVRLLINGKRGPGGFPEAISGATRRMRLWRWSEIAEWLTRHDLIDAQVAGHAHELAAINAALDLRQHEPKASKRRQLLERLSVG